MNRNRLYVLLKLAFSLLVCCILATADAQTAQQKREVRPIGCFMNVRSDGEHADGYSVRLWSSYTGIIGIIDYHRGLTGDPPMGVLTDVQNDSDTGKISFEAKLTIGVHYCKKHNGIPSQNVLSFQGVLKADRLEGSMDLRDLSDSSLVVVDERKNFLMRREDDCHYDRTGHQSV